MEYLAENLDNSNILCYDILRDIYEYADPLRYIRRDINNKNYDLDEIMYKRMKRFISDNYIHYHRDYAINCDEENMFFVGRENINNPELKNIILYGKNGYKNSFLWKHKRHTHICGLEPSIRIWYKPQMITAIDINYPYSDEDYYSKSLSEVYQLWKNL